jgi:hypothetical protein
VRHRPAEENTFERFGENVGALGSRWDVLEDEDVGLDLLLNVVVLHVDVLCALGGAVGVGYVYCALVVNLEGSRARDVR